MYERHYSAYKYRDGRKRSQFVGPGQTIVLRTFKGNAFFVWRKFIDDCAFWHTIYKRWYKQDGVNCAAFRNDNPKAYLSSELVRQADAVADLCWPGERHYTYVDPKKIGSTNPGYCFLRAGWRRCGRTKRGLIILERITMHNLKPCPFCGNKAYYTESVNGNLMVYVGCSSCGIAFKAARDGYGADANLSKDIVAAWNLRVQPETVTTDAETAKVNVETN